MSDDVKVSVTLPREVVAQIEKLAQANSTTLATAIIDSVRLNDHLTRTARGGAKILVRQPDGTTVEVVRHRP